MAHSWAGLLHLPLLSLPSQRPDGWMKPGQTVLLPFRQGEVHQTSWERVEEAACKFIVDLRKWSFKVLLVLVIKPWKPWKYDCSVSAAGNAFLTSNRFRLKLTLPLYPKQHPNLQVWIDQSAVVYVYHDCVLTDKTGFNLDNMYRHLFFAPFP